MFDKLHKYIENLKEEFIRKFPVYIYSDKLKSFVYKMEDGKTEQGESYTDYTLTSSPTFAINFRKYTRRERHSILKKLNLSAAKSEERVKFEFRYGRIR